MRGLRATVGTGAAAGVARNRPDWSPRAVATSRTVGKLLASQQDALSRTSRSPTMPVEPLRACRAAGGAGHLCPAGPSVRLHLPVQHGIQRTRSRLVRVVIEEVDHAPAAGLILRVGQHRRPHARPRERDLQDLADRRLRPIRHQDQAGPRGTAPRRCRASPSPRSCRTSPRPAAADPAARNASASRAARTVRRAAGTAARPPARGPATRTAACRATVAPAADRPRR